MISEKTCTIQHKIPRTHIGVSKDQGPQYRPQIVGLITRTPTKNEPPFCKNSHISNLTLKPQVGVLFGLLAAAHAAPTKTGAAPAAGAQALRTRVLKLRLPPPPPPPPPPLLQLVLPRLTLLLLLLEYYRCNAADGASSAGDATTSLLPFVQDCGAGRRQCSILLVSNSRAPLRLM